MSKPASLVALVPFYTDGPTPRLVQPGDACTDGDKADAVALGYARPATMPAPSGAVVTLDEPAA